MSARRFIHATIRGNVQGVGFRAFVERQAIERGLDGWVRNRRDGTVEAVVQGNEEAAERFVERAKEGPPSAHVAGIEVSEIAVDGSLAGFRQEATV